MSGYTDYGLLVQIPPALRTTLRPTNQPSLGKSIYGDQNAYEKMTKALTPIHQMTMDCNCTVLMIDHHKKMKSDNPDAILNIQGSAAKGGVADTLIGLYRDKSSTTGKIQIIGRDMGEQILNVSFNSADGVWVNEGAEGSLLLTERRIEILDVVEDLEPAQIRDIVDALESTKGAIHKPLQELTNARYLVKEKKDGKVVYSLSEEYKINKVVSVSVNKLFGEEVIIG